MYSPKLQGYSLILPFSVSLFLPPLISSSLYALSLPTFSGCSHIITSRRISPFLHPRQQVVPQPCPSPLSPHLQCSKVSPSSLPCFSVLLNLAHPQVIAASASKSGSVKPVLTLAWNDRSALKLFLSTFLVGSNFCWKKKLNDKPITALEVKQLA